MLWLLEIMLALLADQNLRRSIVRGLQRRTSKLDIVHTYELGLSETSDPELLDWAAKEQRVVLTHDVNTMPLYAYERLQAGLPMPGLIIVPQELAAARAIDDLFLMVVCGAAEDFDAQVIYLPLK